jgi:two-component system nitrogen regulation response regulator GlnG
MNRILLVEPDATYRGRAERALRARNYRVISVQGSDAALRSLVAEAPQLVIAGCDEPCDEDLRLVRTAREGRHPIPVVVLASHRSTRGAIDFMDAGAYDYLHKPGDPGELIEVVEQILACARRGEAAAEDVCAYREAASERSAATTGPIIGRSPEMIEIFKLIGRIAKSDAAVLIQGESGTGKELVARTIHENSRRAEKPFLAVNCAAIPETLLESELFGHEKGAFTGAAYSRKGKFELSHGGTIFLDEVGDMSLSTQAKILRVLQEHTFERVGGEQTLTADTRIIAATNKSLVDLIETKEFRVDLFYRLKVVSIYLPALRKRHGDHRILVDHFIEKYSPHAKTRIGGISEQALAFLESQPWTGNVRELENAIQTAMVLNRTGMLGCEDFPFLQPRLHGEPGEAGQGALGVLAEEAEKAARAILTGSAAGTAGNAYHSCLAVVEHALVKTALDLCGGNQVRAARLLGISRNTLRTKIEAPR